MVYFFKGPCHVFRGVEARLLRDGMQGLFVCEIRIGALESR